MTSMIPTVTSKDSPLLTDAQLKSELEKCEFCVEKPCKTACPCDLSPADFIMAARVGAPEDYGRAAAAIMSKNPLGGICGMVCPDHFCVQACVHDHFAAPVSIPAVQATIVAKARELGVMPTFKKAKPTGKKVAIVGSGPAGLAAAEPSGRIRVVIRRVLVLSCSSSRALIQNIIV